MAWVQVACFQEPGPPPVDDASAAVAQELPSTPSDGGLSAGGLDDASVGDSGPSDTVAFDVEGIDAKATEVDIAWVDAGPDAAEAVGACLCGDGICEPLCESLDACPFDCKECPDGICSPTENPSVCPADCCGACGDGKCRCSEDPKTCPQDCGTACGDAVCDKGENPQNCSEDCKFQVCGNQICETTDGGPAKCPQDCTPACGNCVCEGGESFETCPVDCGYCGDGVCSPCAQLNELTGECVQDCASPCDDGVACTTDVQEGKACTHTPHNGLCVDSDPCTVDACNTLLGCTHLASTGPCDDGDACTKGETCATGACVGLPVDCEDGNPCTDDGCDPKAGCTHANSAAPCDDGSACTTGDVCKGGACVPGPAPDCSDANPCTDDVCLPASGCAHPANTAACDDGDACTSKDTCALGACAGVPTDCSDANPCTADTCDTVKGCGHAPQGGPCDDGSACTVGEVCAAGACVGGVSLDCADDNPCTGDTCDPVSGCLHSPTSATCDDGSACTVGDVCTGGACAGKALECGDGNPCTDDACDVVKGCVHLPSNATCDDFDACTSGDACVSGACKGGPVDCNDGSPCTTDSCVSTKGCVHAPDDAQLCDDANPCTSGDHCAAGACVGAPIDCGTSTVCHPTGCEPKTGCWSKDLDGVACDDGNSCTFGDKCVSGACIAGAKTCDCVVDLDCAGRPEFDYCKGAVVCSGGACAQNPKGGTTCVPPADKCKTNGCNPATGLCVSGVAASGSACSDNDACTVGDACEAGKCAGTPMVCKDDNPCTSDKCLNGKCTFQLGGPLPCDDGNACTTGDKCVGAQCLGNVIYCNDDNACTTDSCNPSSGCVFAPLDSGSCDDGDYCTVGDTCKAGLCAGAPKVCDDKNPCTHNTCKAGNCTYVPLSGAPCDDGNQCTKDACLSGKCVSSWIPGPCDDGNACTISDECNDGYCNGSMQLDCDDGNPCTADACDPVLGCVNTAQTGSCSDNDPCTTGDHCVGAVCEPLWTDCEDGIACTIDACKPGVGCQNVPVKNCALEFTRWAPSSSTLDERYTVDATAGVVTDKVSGLVWQRAASKVPGTLLEAGKSCAALVLGGQSDWRLPTYAELFSLVSIAWVAGQATINGNVFPETPMNAQFWTGTPFPGSPQFIYTVNFATALTSGGELAGSNANHWRCVRGGGPVDAVVPPLVQNDQIVTDPRTGLLWTTNAQSAWSDAEAQSACVGKVIGGVTGWRVPTLVELFSLLDVRVSPLLPAPTFSYTSNPMRASVPVGFVVDPSGGFVKLEKGYYVRCVK